MTAASLVLMAALSAAATDVQGPVAVMPFKNLNADPSLEWLRTGMAETMVSDLKKSGKVPVVERAQIDKALAEIALQASNGTEESTAARVGKMTGAKTVVVGSFQESSKQLRINARFVAVESGEVVGAAKATGPATNVFVLQDEIIGKLVGTEPKAVAHRKTGETTLKAYKLYAMALTTASDADRVGYLNEAVKLDPDFTYAQDELLAMRERLKQLEARSEKAMEQSEANGEALLDDPKLSDADRTREATALLGRLVGSFHYARALAFAQKVMERHLPTSYGQDPSELAHYYVFFCQLQLKQTDPALRTGEEFLKRYPTSAYFSSVQMQMQTALDSRLEQDKDAADAQKELAKIATEREERREHLKTKPELWANIEPSFDFRECSTLHSHHQYKSAVETCNRFADRHWGEASNPKNDMAATARYFEALSYAQLGDFGHARLVAQKLITDAPDCSVAKAMKTFLNTWPKN